MKIRTIQANELTIKQLIEAVRIAKGINQKELAELIKTSPVNICRWSKEECTINLIDKRQLQNLYDSLPENLKLKERIL